MEKVTKRVLGNYRGGELVVSVEDPVDIVYLSDTFIQLRKEDSFGSMFVIGTIDIGMYNKEDLDKIIKVLEKERDKR